MQKDSLAADLFFVSLSIPGDADGDGALSAADARLTLRATVGLDEPDERGRVAMNVDGAVGITAQDARLILRAAVGLEKENALCFTLESDSGGAGATFGVYAWNDGGYDWTLSADPAVDTVRRFFADTLAPGATGGNPSFFHVHFSAPGEYALRLTLQRAWEDTPIETKTLRVTVL